MEIKSIIIVEDNEEVREGFAILINSMGRYHVVNTYETCESAIANLDKDLPDIVLMDIDLPGINGIEGTEIIKKRRPRTHIIMITVYENSQSVFEALKVGATGYLTKNANGQELIQAIDQVVAGGSPMSSKIARLVVNSFQKNLHSPLSERETEVLTLLAAGKSYSHIAEEIFVAKETVRSHLKNIYTKLQVNSKSEAIAKANREKLI